MCDKPTVFVVDDDEQARKSVCALVRSMGLPAEAFASGEEFLESYRDERPGCLITDLRMPGMSGLDLQARLSERHSPLPVIVVTAYARTPSTVRAIQAGARTVLDRPYAEDDLCDALRAALAEDAARRSQGARRQQIHAALAQLAPLERRVLELVVHGKPNKAIAKELHVSLRTVANRRAAILAKLHVNSTAELIRLTVEAQPYA